MNTIILSKEHVYSYMLHASLQTTLYNVLYMVLATPRSCGLKTQFTPKEKCAIYLLPSSILWFLLAVGKPVSNSPTKQVFKVHPLSHKE